MAQWLIGGIGVLVLLLGVQTYRIDGLKQDNKTLQRDNLILEDNFDTCQRTNATNVDVIERQRNSIRQFMLAQDEALERNRTLAEELAARQLADNEQSEAVRNEVSEILSAEACGSVEHPARVHRLLNDAIAKASGGRDG